MNHSATAPPDAKTHRWYYATVALMGFLIGWLGGKTNFDSTVIAAILTVIVPAVGGSGFWLIKQGKLPNPERTLFYAFLVFGIVLFLSMHVGAVQYRAASEDDRKNFFLDCMEDEVRYNKMREILKLAPLPSKYYCSPEVRVGFP